jgi:choline dehydrogenase
VRRATGGTPGGLPDDRAAVAAHVAAHAYSVPHVVGTCAMGPTPAAGGVVDARLRVHGVEGLMVADASVIPLPPSGFTHLPTILVAERVAELMARS